MTETKQSTTGYRTTAIILSGGSGSDFNRKDKGLESWRGKPLIQHCIHSLQPQVDEIIICCNRHHEQYQQFGYRLCQDLRPVFQGPLAGIEAGLKACKSDYAILFPSDSAIAPEGLVKALLEGLLKNNADVAYLKSRPISQYLVAAMRPELADSAADFLDNGGRMVREWYEDLDVVEVDYQNSNTEIYNFNSPDELI